MANNWKDDFIHNLYHYLYSDAAKEVEKKNYEENQEKHKNSQEKMITYLNKHRHIFTVMILERSCVAGHVIVCRRIWRRRCHLTLLLNYATCNKQTSTSPHNMRQHFGEISMQKLNGYELNKGQKHLAKAAQNNPAHMACGVHCHHRFKPRDRQTDIANIDNNSQHLMNSMRPKNWSKDFKMSI